MPFIRGKRSKKLYTVCDTCGYKSRYPRKDENDIPKDWGGGKDYLRCSYCENECYDAWSEQSAAMAYNLR